MLLPSTTETLFHEETMVVVARCGNFGRNLTRTTTRNTWEELQRAASILTSNDSLELLMETVLHPFNPEFLSSIVVDVPISDPTVAAPADVKAWGCSHVLGLVVALERELGDASRIRSLARPKQRNGSFCFVMGVTERPSNGFIQKQTTRLQVELQASFSYPEVTKAQIRCLVD